MEKEKKRIFNKPPDEVHTKNITKDGYVYLGKENEGGSAVFIMPAKFSGFFRYEDGDKKGALTFNIDSIDKIGVRKIDSHGRIYIHYKDTGKKTFILLYKEKDEDLKKKIEDMNSFSPVS